MSSLVARLAQARQREKASVIALYGRAHTSRASRSAAFADHIACVSARRHLQRKLRTAARNGLGALFVITALVLAAFVAGCAPVVYKKHLAPYPGYYRAPGPRTVLRMQPLPVRPAPRRPR